MIVDIFSIMDRLKFLTFTGKLRSHLRRSALANFKYFLCIILCTSLCIQCIVPIEDNPGAVQDVVVIEGFIDDDFGPHEISVSAISPFASIQDGGATRRLEAEVKLFDDAGNVIPLERETGLREDIGVPPLGAPCIPPQCECIASTRSCAGCILRTNFASNYFTPETFRGDPLRSYSLEVTIAESGKTYRSEFQRMEEKTVLDSIFFTFNRFPTADEFTDRTGVDVYGIWDDDPDTENYYLFALGGTYRIETPCGNGCIYDPRDEFGEECWVEESDIGPFLYALDDLSFNGAETIQKVGFVEDDGKRFSSNVVRAFQQYHCNVSMYSVNKQAYEYYSNLRVLSEINGEIFDPPPVRPVGNFLNVSDPGEIVIGFFGVFSKADKGVFVSRSVLEERKFHGTCGDCRYFRFNGQLEIPEVYR